MCDEGNPAFVRRFYAELWNEWRLELIDELLAAGDRVATRMTWTGTHRGRLGELEPTGARSSTRARRSFGSRTA